MKVIKYLILTPSRKSGEKRKNENATFNHQNPTYENFCRAQMKKKKRMKKDEELKSEKKDYDSDM